MTEKESVIFIQSQSRRRRERENLLPVLSTPDVYFPTHPGPMTLNRDPVLILSNYFLLFSITESLLMRTCGGFTYNGQSLLMSK